MNRTCKALLNLSAIVVALGIWSGASLAQSMPPISQNPLHWAAAKNDVAALKALLDRSPDQIDSADGDSRTALHYAAANGATDAASLLIQRGANLNIATHRTDIKAAANVTPLHWAIESNHFDIARKLVSAHANVNAIRTDSYQTPLWMACGLGNIPLIYALLEAGADPKYQNPDKWTCLNWFCVHTDDPGVVKAFLMRGVDPTIRNYFGNTALCSAMWQGAPGDAKTLLDNGSGIDERGDTEPNEKRDQVTCTGYAAERNAECLRLALAYGGDPTIKDSQGRDGLQLAIDAHKADCETLLRSFLSRKSVGWTAAHYAAQENIVDAFSYLRDHGKPLDTPANDGLTPLMVACINNKTEASAKLLVLNHQFDLVDAKRETALHKAVRQDNELLCKLLIAAGADTTIRNKDGESAGGLAHHLGFNDLEAALKTVSVTGASPTLLRKFLANRDAISIQEIVKKDKSLVTHRYAKDWTPLHFAAFEGDNASAGILLDNGADTEARNENGTTPLMLAVQEGRSEVVKLLLTRKASLSVRDKQGWTPLHIAAQENRVEIARDLIRAGARKNVRDNKGRTPRDVALMTGHELLAKSL
jgi:ankyrin repeat protein